MSWGERSCKHYAGSCPVTGTPETCTIECTSYVYDGKTKRDTVVRVIEEGLGLSKKVSRIPRGKKSTYEYPKIRISKLSRNAKKRLRKQGVLN